MTFDPLLGAPAPIPLHGLLALCAIVLGAVQFALPKGRRLHRVLGWIRVLIMAGIALSAIPINEIRLWGRWSPIHLLIPVTLASLVFAIRAARRRNIKAHRQTMIQLYLLALIVTGLFTLMPGRVMHQIVFGN